MCSSKLGTLDSFIAEHQQCLAGYSLCGTPLVNCLNPGILQTTANKAGSPDFTEVTNGPDSAGFLKSLELKVETLLKMETIEIIQQTQKLKLAYLILL